MEETRLSKSVKNARINLTFYFIILFASFFSRKIFLDSLGDDFVGLTTTLISLLGMINIAEFGVGGAISYMLYKPIHNGDRDGINEILSIYGYVYRRIGFIVLIISLSVLPFIPQYLKNSSSISMDIVYFTYLIYLVSSLLGYFVNYKQILFNADQREYEITTYFQLSNIFKLAIQISIAYYTGNPFWWIATEIIFSLLYSLVISYRIKRVYPWLITNIKNGRTLMKKYPEFIVKTKQIFIHFFSGTILVNLPSLIFASWSLSLVATFNNYSLITSKLNQLVGHTFSSTTASVGSIVAEGKKGMIHRVYWEMSSITFFIAGVLLISLYFLIDPFVSIWVGESFVLSNTTVYLIIITMYLNITRKATESFLFAYGLFADVWAPVIEICVNLSLSIIGAIYFGIDGVLAGSAISVLMIVHIWKPYYLFTKGLKLPVIQYVVNVIKSLSITVIVLILVYFISEMVSFNYKNSYLWWILYAVIIFSISSLALWLGMYIATNGMREATHRILNSILNKFKK